jgi:hypothetical protein
MVGRLCCSGCGCLLDGRGQRGPGGGGGIVGGIEYLGEGEMERCEDLPLVRQEIEKMKTR